MLVEIIYLVVNDGNGWDETYGTSFFVAQASLFEVLEGLDLTEVSRLVRFLLLLWLCELLELTNSMSNSLKQFDVWNASVDVRLIDVSLCELRVKFWHNSYIGEHFLSQALEHLEWRVVHRKENTALLENWMSGEDLEIDSKTLVIVIHVVDNVFLLLESILHNLVLEKRWLYLHDIVVKVLSNLLKDRGNVLGIFAKKDSKRGLVFSFTDYVVGVEPNLWF